MADEAEEVNTVAEDGGADEQKNEVDASTHETEGELGCHDGPDRTEKFPATAAAENSWSAPLLSLARKATETISSGVNYAASQRNPPQGSAMSSPTEKEAENDVDNASKRLPGQLDAVFLGDSLNFTETLSEGCSHKVCVTTSSWFVVSCHGT